MYSPYNQFKARYLPDDPTFFNPSCTVLRHPILYILYCNIPAICSHVPTKTLHETHNFTTTSLAERGSS